jgi:hypothetical protein
MKEFMKRHHDAAAVSHQSRDLVQALAKQTQRPMDEAQRVFESQFQQLERGASVRIYLPLLAARRAREILLQDRPRGG